MWLYKFNFLYGFGKWHLDHYEHPSLALGSIFPLKSIFFPHSSTNVTCFFMIHVFPSFFGPTLFSCPTMTNWMGCREEKSPTRRPYLAFPASPVFCLFLFTLLVWFSSHTVPQVFLTPGGFFLIFSKSISFLWHLQRWV